MIVAVSLPAYGRKVLEIVVPSHARAQFQSVQTVTRTLNEGECVTNCGIGFLATKKWRIRKASEGNPYWIVQGKKKIGPFDGVFAPFGNSGSGPAGIVERVLRTFLTANSVTLLPDTRHLIVEKTGKLYFADIYGMTQLPAYSPGFELIEEAVEHHEPMSLDDIAPSIAVDPSLAMMAALPSVRDNLMIALKDKHRFLLNGRTGRPTRPHEDALSIETARRKYDPADWATP